MKTVTIIISAIILMILAVIYFSLPKNKNMTSFDIQGMKVEILKEGTGEPAKNGDSVVVNYTGTLPDGTKFDSSLNPGRTPFELSLPGQVIQGWNLGLVGMKVGEQRKLTIPPELAYGPQSPSPLIPPNSTLVFVIDMLSINGK